MWTCSPGCLWCPRIRPWRSIHSESLCTVWTFSALCKTSLPVLRGLYIVWTHTPIAYTYFILLIKECTIHHHPFWLKKVKKERTTQILPLGVSYGVASVSCCSKSICNPKLGITTKITASFWRWTPPISPKGKPLSSPGYPHYDWWTFLVEHLAINNIVNWTLNHSDELLVNCMHR
jgi:hypothetical protein